jgi:tetratricopeptide (TPR) repeat protein
VLWHEFCHVVTLEKTRNKMPRWLSEGISVYEEQQRDPTWGEQLTPQYRQMILDGQLVPVSQLSGAFLQPETPLHLQFAYFASGQAVAYLVETYGHETLQRILADLAVGMPINESLERYVGSLARLDEEFLAYVRATAVACGAALDWQQQAEVQEMTGEELSAWLQQHPRNYWGLRRHAALSLAVGDLAAAERALRTIHEVFPQDRSADCAAAGLAEIYRRRGDREQELAMLEHVASLDSNAIEAYVRLMELHALRADWAAVRASARRLLAVNPLLPTGHERLALAATQLGHHAEAAQALQASLEMDPVDPAGLHFQLAQALAMAGDRQQARRHVLMALEEAPRYREAQKLLLRLLEQAEAGPGDAMPSGQAPGQEDARDDQA